MSEEIPDSIRVRSLKVAALHHIDIKDVFDLASAAYLEGLGEKAKRKSAPDPTYEVFAKMFESKRTLPYANTRADFIQLASLRKRMMLESRGMPEGWDQICRNYFESEFVVRFTLADLCTRADIFMRGPLRRLNGAVSGNGHDGISRQADKTPRGERRFTRH